MSRRSETAKALNLIEKIKDYWADPKRSAQFLPPKLSFDSQLYFIKSNMKNGQPPKIKDLTHAQHSRGT